MIKMMPGLTIDLGGHLSAPVSFSLAVFSCELFMRKHCIGKVRMLLRGGKVAQTQS